VTALTPPFAAAALVLCIAGVAKLRSPAEAVEALRTLGVPGSRFLMRILGVFEVVLGLLAVFEPSRVVAAVVAALYAVFCAVSLLLARHRAACGCFGEAGTPASALQSLLSGALSLVALAAATAWPLAHGLAAVFDSGSPALGAVLLFGIAAVVYALVLAYTELPSAWSAWSGR
jgi:uncharacterized membrane protein YphA (DoxX/SURF4 family)